MDELSGLLSPDFTHPEQPKTLSCRFDGRLDNREDLLRRYAIHPECSDSELALQVYRTGGERALGDLIGDWSLAITDPGRRRHVLASDYAGMRPLYYSETGKRLAWASLLPRILALTGERELDDDYFRELLATGGSSDRTPYRGIRTVPPGHAVIAGEHGTRLVRIWSLRPLAVRFSREHDYIDRLQSLMEEAVATRLNTSEPVYAELSGGLDSSSIAAIACKLIAQGRVPASELVTVTYRHTDSPDNKFQHLIRRSFGFKSLELDVRDYPFFGAESPGRSMPQWWEKRHRELAQRMQNHGARVLMTGQLGDLTLGNWTEDFDQVAEPLHRGQILQACRSSLAWSVACRVSVYSILWRAVRLNVPGWLEDAPPLENSLRGNRKAFELTLDSNWREASPGRRQHYRMMTEVLSARTLQPPEPFRQCFYTHPYSHRPLVEFMLSIPPEVVAGPSEPRRLMRRALAGLLPPEVLARRSKASFERVFAASVRPMAALLLREPTEISLEQRGIIDGLSFKSRLRRYLQGLECNVGQLRLIILAECWLRNQQGTASIA